MTQASILNSLAERCEQPCSDCEGKGWHAVASPRCCGRSDWECGGRGCTGPEPEWEQEQCEACQGTGVVSQELPTHQTPEAVEREMHRIRRLFEPSDGGDREDLATYAKQIVALRAHAAEATPSLQEQS